MFGMPSVHSNVTRSLKGSKLLDPVWQVRQRVWEDLGHGGSALVWEGNDVATYAFAECRANVVQTQGVIAVATRHDGVTVNTDDCEEDSFKICGFRQVWSKAWVQADESRRRDL